MNELRRAYQERDLKKEDLLDFYNGLDEKWTLYQSLHMVGDDMIKAVVEDNLRRVLPPETFELVRKVFMAATNEDILTAFVDRFDPTCREEIEE